MQQHPLDFIVRIGPGDQGGSQPAAANAPNPQPPALSPTTDDARSIGVPFATPTDVPAENASNPSDESGAEAAVP